MALKGLKDSNRTTWTSVPQEDHSGNMAERELKGREAGAPKFVRRLLNVQR